LIDPADLPERPERPNRPVILVLAGLLAMIGGIGAGVVAEQLDETIRSVDHLTLAAGLAPLASIPYWATTEEMARRLRRRRAFQLASVGVVAAVVTVSHYLWLPLDVVWFAALRKLGLT
jgi:hypothetical protein